MKRARLVVPIEYGSQKKTLDVKDLFEDGLIPEWWQSTTASESAGSLKRSGRHLRQLMALMERPFFSVSKRSRSSAEYTSPDGSIDIRIEAGPTGMATIFDADLLMFLVDHIAGAGLSTASSHVLKPANYFAAVGSKCGGGQYQLLGDAIERLRTTRITTNAQPDGKPGSIRTFCWFEDVARQSGAWHLTLPDWLIEGARSKFILSICPEYFGLGGFERFLYLTARKHVGSSAYKTFPIGIATLWKKSGSSGTLPRFRHQIRSLVKKNALPEYALQWNDRISGDSQVIFSLK